MGSGARSVAPRRGPRLNIQQGQIKLIKRAGETSDLSTLLRSLTVVANDRVKRRVVHASAFR